MLARLMIVIGVLLLLALSPLLSYFVVTGNGFGPLWLQVLTVLGGWLIFEGVISCRCDAR